MSDGVTVIFVPGRPGSANTARGFWAVAAKRKAFRKLAGDLAAAHLTPHGTYTYQVRITARQIVNQRRSRDPGGLAEMLKPLLDGLVDATLIIDDNEDAIELHLAHSLLDTKRPIGIELTIEPVWTVV